MKKLRYYLILLVGLLSINCFAADKPKESNLVNGVSAIHNDVASATSSVYNDAKSAVSSLYNDGKVLAKDLYPDIKNAVIAIGKSIGVAAEHVYGVLVKKYFVDGLKELFLFLIGVVLLIIGWVKTEQALKTCDKVDWRVVYPFALCAAAIISLINVDYNVMFMGLVNPEWGAIDYILEYSKTLIGK